MGQALSTYAGQNYGAGKAERIHEGFKQSMAAVSAFAVLLFIGMQIFGYLTVSAFVKARCVAETTAAWKTKEVKYETDNETDKDDNRYFHTDRSFALVLCAVRGYSCPGLYHGFFYTGRSRV